MSDAGCVLVVDDEAEIRAVLQSLLGHAGWEVVVVATSPGRPAVAGVGVGAKPVAKAVTPPCPIAQANAQAANAVCTIEDRFNLACRVMAFVPRGDNAMLAGPCGLARVAWAGHCVLNPSATLGRRWLKLKWHRGA